MNHSESQLIDAYLDGNLTAEQGESLQQLLRKDRDARAALRRRATIDEGLTDLAVAASIANRSTNDDANGDGKRAAAGVVGSRIRIVIPWGIAAALALALLYGSFSSPDPKRETKATAESFLGLLVDEAGAEFEPGFGPNDVRFDAREYRLRSGAIHLRLENGADLVMRSPAAFRLHDPFNIELLNGSLRAVAPPSAEGLTVAAPKVNYEDLGTEFGITVNRDSGASRIHVFDGQVDAKQAGSNQLLSSVTSGQSMQFADDQWKTTAAPVADEFLAPGQIGFQRWRQWRARFIRDPSLIAFYSFQRDPTAPDQLANDSGRASNGMIRGARWVSGRWPGKEALLFDRDDDFVALTIPGEYDEFTFSFWVKVDRLDYEYNALLNSDVWEPGDLHFQIKRTGMVWANVNDMWAGPQTTPNPVQNITGDPIERGRWQHIVGVVSRPGQKCLTYVNGKLVRTIPNRLANPVAPGECRLGNWLPIPDWHHAPVRGLKGRMDEVAIWSRALTEQEIKAHYEAGRPSLLDE